MMMKSLILLAAVVLAKADPDLPTCLKEAMSIGVCAFNEVHASFEENAPKIKAFFEEFKQCFEPSGCKMPERPQPGSAVAAPAANAPAFNKDEVVACFKGFGSCFSEATGLNQTQMQQLRPASSADQSHQVQHARFFHPDKEHMEQMLSAACGDKPEAIAALKDCGIKAIKNANASEAMFALFKPELALCKAAMHCYKANPIEQSCIETLKKAGDAACTCQKTLTQEGQVCQKFGHVLAEHPGVGACANPGEVCKKAFERLQEYRANHGAPAAAPASK